MATSALSAAVASVGKRLLLSRPASSFSFASSRLAAAGSLRNGLLGAAPRRDSCLSFASRHLAAEGPLRTGLLGAAPRRSCSSATAPPAAAATIAVGDRLPDATLSYLDSLDGDVKTVTVRDLTAGKKVVLFAVSSAFTPTSTQKHVRGFVAKFGELRAKGVDTVACVSVNSAFVMRAWKESLEGGDEMLMLSDESEEFTRTMGVELELFDDSVELGLRSRRYALLADDGVVKVLNLEEGDAFTNSSAEDILEAL